MQPFDELNSHIRNMDDRFTKREMIATHVFCALITRDYMPSSDATIELTLKVTDKLLEALRDKASVTGK